MASELTFFGSTWVDGYRDNGAKKDERVEPPPPEQIAGTIPKALQALIWRKKKYGKHRGPVGRLNHQVLAQLMFWEELASLQGVTLTAEEIIEDMVSLYGSELIPRPKNA